MRANSKALRELFPTSDLIVSETGKGRYSSDAGKWLVLKAPSPSALLDARQAHANTANEAMWNSSRPSWIGLGRQSLSDFLQTRRSPEASRLFLEALAKLGQKPARPGVPGMAVSSPVWDIPSVLAGLPLAAKTRQRTKLPPVDIHIAISASAMVTAEALAALSCKLSRAMYDYKIAGGAVSLTLSCPLRFSRPTSDGYTGAVIQTRVNVSDQAALAWCVSPIFLRAVAGALGTALSDSSGDCLYPPHANIIPGAIYFGGYAEEGERGAAEAIKRLTAV